MKPPKPFTVKKDHGWSKCQCCDKWNLNNRFKHEGVYWILCAFGYADYWENTDELKPDYVGF